MSSNRKLNYKCRPAKFVPENFVPRVLLKQEFLASYESLKSYCPRAIFIITLIYSQLFVKMKLENKKLAIAD